MKNFFHKVFFQQNLKSIFILVLFFFIFTPNLVKAQDCSCVVRSETRNEQRASTERGCLRTIAASDNLKDCKWNGNRKKCTCIETRENRKKTEAGSKKVCQEMEDKFDTHSNCRWKGRPTKKLCYCKSDKKDAKFEQTKAESLANCKAWKEVPEENYTTCKWTVEELDKPQQKDEESDETKQPSFSLPNASKLNKLGTDSIPQLIGRIIEVTLQVVGTAALIMFIYGGLLIMTSEGKSDRYYKGMKTMLWSALGTVTIFASYALVDFVLQAF